MSTASETAETVHNVGKAKLTNSLRLMTDNQRTLNTTGNQDARLRDLHIREQEAEARKRYPDIADPSPATEEPMDIRVDSPTTVNHNYPTPPASAPAEVSTSGAPRRSSWLLPAALAVGSALAGAAGPTGFLIYQAMKTASETPPPAVETPVDTMQQIVVE